MNIKVSVIIPVFNAEKYIEECIKSLINQTLPECEFIFVNDGSSDSSRTIIEKYQQIDNRIILFNQENKGVSGARNKGIDISTGEYIGFVDADDCLEKDMYEVMYVSANKNNCDIIISNIEGEAEGSKKVTVYPFPIDVVLYKNYIEKTLLPYFIKEDNLNSVCTKIFKNKVVKEKNIIFPEKVALGEDGIFNIHFLSHAKTVKYIDYTGYHYREVDGSATRNIAEIDYFKRALEVYKLKLHEQYYFHIDKVMVDQLKSIKLIKSVISYIYFYFASSKDLSFRKKYTYIKRMITNEYVQDSLPIFYRESYNSLGRYDKFIVKMINRKSILGLYCATTYSRFRNK